MLINYIYIKFINIIKLNNKGLEEIILRFIVIRTFFIVLYLLSFVIILKLFGFFKFKFNKIFIIINGKKSS